MKRLLALLFLLATSAWGSDAVLTWQAGVPVVNTLGYEIHLGTSPVSYTNVVTLGNVLTHTYADGTMFQNVRNYLAITASNPLGTGPLSEEYTGYPRPTITGTSVVNQGTFLRMSVTGTNFSDVVLTTDIDFTGMTVLDVVRVDANNMHVDYTVDDGFQDQPTDLVIQNGWTGNAGFVDSLPSEVFIVPGIVPPAPVLLGIE